MTPSEKTRKVVDRWTKTRRKEQPWVGAFEFGADNMTHWMPLPEPPND